PMTKAWRIDETRTMADITVRTNPHSVQCRNLLENIAITTKTRKNPLIIRKSRCSTLQIQARSSASTTGFTPFSSLGSDTNQKLTHASATRTAYLNGCSRISVADIFKSSLSSSGSGSPVTFFNSGMASQVAV